MINITWDFIVTIAITAFVTGSCNAIANYMVYRLLLKNLDRIENKVNGKTLNR